MLGQLKSFILVWSVACGKMFKWTEDTHAERSNQDSEVSLNKCSIFTRATILSTADCFETINFNGIEATQWCTGLQPRLTADPF